MKSKCTKCPSRRSHKLKIPRKVLIQAQRILPRQYNEQIADYLFTYEFAYIPTIKFVPDNTSTTINFIIKNILALLTNGIPSL